jgi:hypothetical protein
VHQVGRFAQNVRRLNSRFSDADLLRVIVILAVEHRGSLMEHVVFYPGPDAAPAFRRFATLEEAVRFVEHLRNAEEVSEVSVHALSPVPVAFRAYYKVEVPVAEMPAPVLAEVPVQSVEPVEPVEVTPVAELAEVPALADTADEVDPALVPVAAGEPEPAANGKRSLGFFAH